MLLAGSVRLDQVVENLAARRPVFHSEADFQHAFAWETHRLDSSMRVRLETHPEPGVRLDVLLSRPDLGQHTAVELKYLTRGWTASVQGEHFQLSNHGAQDVRAYDVVKDIARIERFVLNGAGWSGLVFVLANDPMYWRAATHGRETNAAAFRLYDGTTLHGRRAWGPRTGAGTMRGREASIALARAHELRWRPYSRLEGASGHFQALLVEVTPE